MTKCKHNWAYLDRIIKNSTHAPGRIMNVPKTYWNFICTNCNWKIARTSHTIKFPPFCNLLTEKQKEELND